MGVIARGARAVADSSLGTVIAVVEVGVSPERAFAALTDAGELPRWWGSTEAYRVTSWDVDLRVGGAWRSHGHGASGEPLSIGGTFVDVRAPHLVVMTWHPAWDRGEPTVVRFHLEALDGGTRITVRHDGLPAAAGSYRSHTDGWEGILGRLEAHLTRGDADAPRSFFMCLLVPPRPTFMADMTADERALMGAHAAYWRELAVRGSAVVFGPVAEANGGGGFGLGVLEAADEAEVRRMEARDPVILANVGFRYEVMPMLRAVLRSDLR
jgi:uncharacterized protein YndB with AHSA1/START domain